VFDVRYGPIRVADVLGRLIRNPNYGGPSAGAHGWTWRPDINKASKPVFAEALTEDIKKNGVRNPILVYCFDDSGLYLVFGGSRWKSAQLAGMEEIPAIINDYTRQVYADLETVTPENVTSFFTDPPRDYEFGEKGFDYHYNLERARRQNHDPAGFAWYDGTPPFIAREFPWLITKGE
jgi:hypothetical protein